jgi:hypothetical protein
VVQVDDPCNEMLFKSHGRHGGRPLLVVQVDDPRKELLEVHCKLESFFLLFFGATFRVRMQ